MTATDTTTADFVVHDSGSIVLFEPASPAAREWVDDNVALDSWQWLGNSFGVERRFAHNLAYGMIADGFRVAGGFLFN